MTNNIQIRAEAASDSIAVEHLTLEAFSSSPLGYHGEAELIATLRLADKNHFSLVACQGNQLVGHLLFSSARLIGDKATTWGMGLAPLSVSPAVWRKGIGSALVTKGIETLMERGCNFVFVLGHPEYYPRFGFVPAQQFGIKHGFQGIAQEHFFVLFNSKAVLPSDLRNAKAYYHSHFGPQHGEPAG